MSTVLYKKHDHREFTVSRFFGGTSNGVLAQLTIDGKHVVLRPKEMRDVADILRDIADYAEAKRFSR